VHAPTQDKSDYMKDGFYDELERVMDQFPKKHRKVEKIFSNQQSGMKVYMNL